MKRRDFLIGASSTVLGLTLPSGVACRRAGSGNDGGGDPRPEFPLLEVSGTPYEVGVAIGRRFGDQIKKGLERRREWFGALRSFMEEDLATRYEPFLAAGRQHFPEVLEELRGWAAGSGVAFKDLMALNLRAELAAMMRDRQDDPPGCSTLALSHAGRLLLAHNEDGDGAYHDLMFLVRVSRPGKPTFLCLTYPGILSGNGPAMNDAGMVITTNFISGLAVRPGVPRYFISRAVLEATSLDAAVEIVTHPRRAFAFHFNLGSHSEKRILSVETSVEKHEVHQVDGLYVHTNHLLLPGMKDTPQDREYMETSSLSRYRVLRPGADRLRGRLDDVDRETLVGLLSGHEGAPTSPCRHPTEEASGATLACSVFDLDAGSLELFFSNPCRGISTSHGPMTALT
jgi:hypothetical protein